MCCTDDAPWPPLAVGGEYRRLVGWWGRRPLLTLLSFDCENVVGGSSDGSEDDIMPSPQGEGKRKGRRSAACTSVNGAVFNRAKSRGGGSERDMHWNVSSTAVCDGVHRNRTVAEPPFFPQTPVYTHTKKNCTMEFGAAPRASVTFLS